MKCSKDGVSGWKFGASGHCYPGKEGKKKAIRQGLAEGNGKWPTDAAHEDEVTQAELNEALAEFKQEALAEQINAYISKKERDKIPKEDFGDPENEAFPVQDQSHLDSAVKLLGKESPEKQKKIKERLKKIARRKNLKLPESWS